MKKLIQKNQRRRTDLNLMEAILHAKMFNILPQKFLSSERERVTQKVRLDQAVECKLIFRRRGKSDHKNLLF